MAGITTHFAPATDTTFRKEPAGEGASGDEGWVAGVLEGGPIVRIYPIRVYADTSGHQGTPSNGVPLSEPPVPAGSKRHLPRFVSRFDRARYRIERSWGPWHPGCALATPSRLRFSDILVLGLGALACVALARACRRALGARTRVPEGAASGSSTPKDELDARDGPRDAPSQVCPARPPLWQRVRAWLQGNQVWFTTVGWLCLTGASVAVGLVSLSVSGRANRLAARANEVLDRQTRVFEAQLQPQLEVRRDTAGGSETLLVTNRGGYLSSPDCSVYTYLAFVFHSADRRTRLGPEFFATTDYWSPSTLMGPTEGVLFRAVADSASVRELARRDKSLGRIDVPAVDGRPAGALVRSGAWRSALAEVVVEYKDALGEDRSRAYRLSRDEAAASEGRDPMAAGLTGSFGSTTPMSVAPRIPLERLDAATIREAYISQYAEYPMKADKAGAGAPRLAR